MDSENLALLTTLIPKELLGTLYMVFASTLLAVLFGTPIGALLFLSDRGGLRERRTLYLILGFAVNVARSIPFAILMIALIPFTRLIVGTSLGTTAAIVPLTLSATAFFLGLPNRRSKQFHTALSRQL